MGLAQAKKKSWQIDGHENQTEISQDETLNLGEPHQKRRKTADVDAEEYITTMWKQGKVFFFEFYKWCVRCALRVRIGGRGQ